MENTIAQKAKEKPIPANVKITVSQDLMEATMVIDPPKYGGKDVDASMIDNALRIARVTYGINVPLLESIKKKPRYNNSYIFAKGTAPRNGSDGSIEYLFQTKAINKPKVKEDGSVDYRDLGLVVNVKQGQLLAKIVLPTQGVEGMAVNGRKLTPVAGKAVASPVGRNTSLNDSETALYSSINGHASLIGSRVNVVDTFIVSNDVGISTGNIKSICNVSILGSVSTGFSVDAEGNVEIGKNVEGGSVKAGGNLQIHGGVVGMNSAKINAKGNLSSSFFENCDIVCGGSMKTESIMASNVKCAGKLELYGMRAKIVGGRYIIGGDLVATEIGSFSNIPTQIILGADPTIMTRYSAIQSEIKQLSEQIPKLQQIVELLSKFQQAGSLPYSKRRMFENSTLSLKKDMEKLDADNKEFKELNELIQNAGKGKITCRGTIYRGVKITIGFASMLIENDMTCSCFSFNDGKIVVTPASSY